MKKKKELMLSILGVICLVLITVGVTYAFFSYSKEGTTDNTITTGTITFLYTEISEVGRGISIEDAYPVSDSVGKAQTGEGKVFDFKVTSNTPNSSSISYEVTARKKDTSTLSEDAIKLYLTKVTGTTEEEVILAKYSELTTTDKVDSTKYNEKTLYKGKLPANTTDYEQAFRLRMWIDEEVDFSDGTMNDKEFTVTVNVYANAKVVTADEEELLASTDITSVTVDGETASLVTGEAYDYEVELIAGTTDANIKITTLNEYATVEVEKIDNLAYNTNIKRLSAIKNLSLTSGDNYFKITVTSENKENTKEYKLKVVVPKDTDNTLSSLSVSNCPLNEKFNSETTEYTCTIAEGFNSTTVIAVANSSLASIVGNTEHDLVIGENIITVTVTSEAGKDKVYTVKVTMPEQPILLSDAIFSKYTTIYTNPTLTDSSNNTSDASGLYKSTLTNSGYPTYYFRGNVENYIDFAGFTWRVVRINEDGTIRIVMQNGINDDVTYKINSASNNKDYMYYTNGDTAKKELENWYSSKIASNDAYANRVATGEYYCEQAKVASNDTFASNSGASMTVYTAYENPNFKCKPDTNGHGLVNASVGLLSYDEVLHAGGYYGKANDRYYLYNKTFFWTMSPDGFFSAFGAHVWYVSTAGTVSALNVNDTNRLRPVLNLKADTAVTGLGTSDSHWVVQS